MLEVLAGSEHGEVAALKGDGTPLWTCHASAGATGITAADLDGDGHVESAVSLRDGHLLLLDDNGKPRWQYYWEPREPDQAGLWESVAGDINGDGQRELVLGTEDGHGLALSAEGKLLWSVDIEQRAPGCPTLLDLNGDGKYEIIMTSVARAIWALDGSGKTIWSFRQRDGGGFYYTVAADLNGDGRVELFAATPGGDYCLRTDMRCKKYEVLWGLQRGDARRSGVR
jgi:outer membrane protein assembly factor BamB